MSSETTPSAPPLGFAEAFARFGRWCAAKPWQAVLLGACLATLIWFVGFVHIWVNGAQTLVDWSMHAWSNKAGEQAYCKFVPLVSIFLVWFRRDRYAAAPKAPSNWGLLFLAMGVASFVLGVRCLQPRLALFAMPFIFFGATLFLWGRHVARLALFPCAFLLFMIPMAALEQGTFRLQFIITGTVEVLSRLVGLHVQAIGTALTARDGAFNFEIAGTCSGVRSLAAMSMLTAVYVHLTQDRLWKKLLIFAASLLFAVVGNVGRILAVLIVARFISPELAGGPVHDYSGFIFFPIAVLMMTGFSRLVNLPWKDLIGSLFESEEKPIADFAKEDVKPETKPGGPISYDY
jgi:exosortase